MAKTEKTPTCWLWRGANNGRGYGVMAFRGRQEYAHRIMWTLVNGELADGTVVMHVCDVPSCVRPDHLSIGTQADNLHDMIRKGRENNWGGKGRSGVTATTAKLTEDQVREIRAAAERGEQGRSIARRYPVTESCIYRVIQRKTYADV